MRALLPHAREWRAGVDASYILTWLARTARRTPSTPWEPTWAMAYHGLLLRPLPSSCILLFLLTPARYCRSSSLSVPSPPLLPPAAGDAPTPPCRFNLNKPPSSSVLCHPSPPYNLPDSSTNELTTNPKTSSAASFPRPTPTCTLNPKCAS
jgi:hypothetical protein